MMRLIAVLVGMCLAGETPLVRAQEPGSDRTAPADSSKYLAPGDRVKLEIWREPDLSGEFEVDEGGMAMLPKLGPTRVTGLTSDALKAELISRYQVYLRNPTIGVTVLHRVSVEGAVRNPGIYTVAPTMTLADVLALAGGATSDGKADRFELVR